MIGATPRFTRESMYAAMEVTISFSSFFSLLSFSDCVNIWSAENLKKLLPVLLFIVSRSIEVTFRPPSLISPESRFYV